MADRLQELLRQKALLDEHAAWLDREIAAERAAGATEEIPGAPPPAPAPGAPEPVADPTPTSAPGGALAGQADAILEQYRRAPGSIHQDVRRGCFLYFAAALALTALAVVAFHFLYRHR